jgi:hypothetical protein
MRTVARQEVWALLKQAGLVADPEPAPLRERKRPSLRLVKEKTD